MAPTDPKEGANSETGKATTQSPSAGTPVEMQPGTSSSNQEDLQNHQESLASNSDQESQSPDEELLNDSNINSDDSPLIDESPLNERRCQSASAILLSTHWPKNKPLRKQVRRRVLTSMEKLLLEIRIPAEVHRSESGTLPPPRPPLPPVPQPRSSAEQNVGQGDDTPDIRRIPFDNARVKRGPFDNLKNHKRRVLYVWRTMPLRIKLAIAAAIIFAPTAMVLLALTIINLLLKLPINDELD